MNNHVAVDFESYYDKEVSITTLGVWGYLRHPMCEVYMVSVWAEDGHFVGHPKDFNWHDILDRPWVSHNAAFDRECYARLIELGHAPNVHPPEWFCSANLSAFLGDSERNLAASAKAYLDIDITKDTRKAMMGITHDAMHSTGFYKEVAEYALRDAEICWKLWHKMSDKWPAQERMLSELTILHTQRGLPCDVQYLDEGIQTLDRVAWEAAHKLPWAEDGDEDKVLSSIYFAIECRKQGIEPPPSMAQDSIECAEWEAAHPDINWIQARRDYLKANLLRTKLKTMRSRVRDDGRLSYGIKYCGTHTGRWSGDAKFNVQGFQKAQISGVDMRRVIHVQDPNKKLVIADLSQIEPRVLAWVSGNWEFLDGCRTASVYEVHARQTLGWTGGSLKKEDPKLYALAKARVLGLGYGCSYARFKDYAKTLHGIDLTLVEAKRTVTDFRAKETAIVDLWNKFDEDLKEAATNKEDYVVELPSWRSMKYRKCQYVRREGKQQISAILNGGRSSVLWGSRLAENIIQAIARDVFCEVLLRLEAANFTSILTVHDEVVLEVPKLVSVDEVQALVTQNPSWMPNVPLDSEAVESDFYLK
jgi:hypothetical protein